MKSIILLVYLPFLFLACQSVNQNTTISSKAELSDSLCIIEYKSFEGWKQNQETKKMEFLKEFNDPGYIQISDDSSSIIIVNSRTNEKELFKFIPFEKTEPSGHYLAFGRENSEYAFTLIPEDKLLLIKVNDVVIFKFDLTQEDLDSIIKELD